MKKLIFKILIIAGVLVAVDYAIGSTLDALARKAKGGDTARYIYINDGTDEDILIFGSSRAYHHYDPRVIEAKTGLSAYNCGTDGNGCILFYTQLVNILSRYKPEMIVYDVMPLFDYINQGSNTKYLGRAKLFYGRSPEVDSVFWEIDPNSRCKMLSGMYRHNSSFLQVISDYIKPKRSSVKGYQSLEGEIDYFREPEKQTALDVDSVKLRYLERIVNLCERNGVPVMFVASPTYYDHADLFAPVRELAAGHGIPFLSYYNDPRFERNNAMFVDATHLNSHGAEEFSLIIADDIMNFRNRDIGRRNALK